MIENLKLKSAWTLWENFAPRTRDVQQSDEEWKKSINKVLTFKDLNLFAGVWNNLAYFKPTSSFFYDPSKKTIKRFQVRDRDELEQINCINLFRNEITPAWADPENRAGGEYQILLDDGLKADEIDEIWQDLALSLVGETFKTADQVNGVRIADKTKGLTLQVRMEIWVKFDKDNEPTTALEFEKSLGEFLSLYESKTKSGFARSQYKSHKSMN